MSKTLGYIFIVLLAAGQLHASIITGPVLNPSNGHSYFLITANTWTGAESEAQTSFNSHLVTINDANENQWLVDTFCSGVNDFRVFWIGLNDAASEGNFVWASGQPVTYTNWYTGEPNNSGPNGTDEDYVSFNWHHTVPDANAVRGTWNDETDFGNSSFSEHGGVRGPYFAVVEVVPEPVTLASVGLLGLAMLARRARR